MGEHCKDKPAQDKRIPRKAANPSRVTCHIAKSFLLSYIPQLKKKEENHQSSLLYRHKMCPVSQNLKQSMFLHIRFYHCVCYIVKVCFCFSQTLRHTHTHIYINFFFFLRHKLFSEKASLIFVLHYYEVLTVLIHPSTAFKVGFDKISPLQIPSIIPL